MSEFNIEDLDSVISEAKSSLVQMLALQLQKELKNVAGLEGKNSLLQSKLDLISGLMDATKPAIEIVEQGVSELQSQNADLAVQLANAESKCMELAAELSAVDKIHNESVFITDDHYEQCPPEVQKIIRSLAVLQIPAYDAFLAEVRASGVEMYADNLDSSADDAERDGFDDAVKFLRSESSGVRLFAAQLRKGAVL